MLIMLLLLTALMLFAVYNIYYVLYKQKKYKVVLVTWFYVISLISLTTVIIQVSTQFNQDYCDLLSLVATYIASFFDLNMGICWTAILTELSIKLNDRRDLQQYNQTVFFVLFGLNTVACFVFVILLEAQIQTERLCSPDEWANNSELQQILHVYEYYKIVASGLIDAGLIISSTITIYLLQKYRSAFESKIK